MKSEIQYKNLLTILKMFKNRPHHLAKYLIENKAFTSDFMKKICESDKITNMTKNGSGEENLHFNTILEMGKYYSSLIDDFENLKDKKTKEELKIDLNNSLKTAIDKENYEEASKIRDYMKINNINKI